MLKMWRERKGSDATDEKLIFALSTMPQCKEIQEKGEKYFEEQRNIKDSDKESDSDSGTGGLPSASKEKKSKSSSDEMKYV